MPVYDAGSDFRAVQVSRFIDIQLPYQGVHLVLVHIIAELPQALCQTFPVDLGIDLQESTSTMMQDHTLITPQSAQQN